MLVGSRCKRKAVGKRIGTALTEQPFKQHQTPFGSKFGNFTLTAYEFPTGAEHAALVYGDPSSEAMPLVRVQSSCITGTAFGALLCDCRQQFELSLKMVADAGSGVVLYMDQEGRGYGLVEKVRQLSLISAGLATTATAAPKEDEGADRRNYSHAFTILDSHLSSRSLRLLTNNPKKITAFEQAGYLVERTPIETDPTDNNREYLRVKKEHMGHLLTRV
jgi:GTP cyclohydrolase II